MENRYQDPLSGLKADVARLEKKELQARKMVKALKKIMKDADYLSLHAWMNANEEHVKAIHPELWGYADGIAKLRDEKVLEFEQDLKDAVAAEGWTLDGQWPTYFINRYIRLTINEKQYSCQVEEKKLKTLSVTGVITHARMIISGMKMDKTTLTHFLHELYGAYAEVQRGDAQSVAVWEIYRNLVLKRQTAKFWRDATSKNFKSFGEMEFRAFVTELLMSNMTFVSGHQMKLLPPISKDESVFIFQPVENRYCHVGRISFLPDTVR